MPYLYDNDVTRACANNNVPQQGGDAILSRFLFCHFVCLTGLSLLGNIQKNPRQGRH